MYVYEMTGDVTGVMRACGNDVIAAHAVNCESCRFPVIHLSVYCALLRPSVCPLPIAAAHRRRSNTWDLILPLIARATDRLRPAIITLVICQRKKTI